MVIRLSWDWELMKKVSCSLVWWWCSVSSLVSLVVLMIWLVISVCFVLVVRFRCSWWMLVKVRF